MLQGPFVPAHNEMKRLWVADDPGKPIALMVIGLGNRIGGALASSLTPALASAYGWRPVAYAYGVTVAAFSVLWQLAATNGPTVRLQCLEESERAHIEAAVSAAKKAGRSVQAATLMAQRTAKIKARCVCKLVLYIDLSNNMLDIICQI